MFKYIPAETKVALCIKADAGKGASIESGSHLKKTIADLKKDEIIKQKQTMLELFKSKLFIDIFWLLLIIIIKHIIKIGMSLTLLKKKADNADLYDLVFS